MSSKELPNHHQGKAKKAKSLTSLDKHERIIGLADLYGQMLTQRQRSFLKWHFEEDMSFSEIAAEEGVSRQAVHLAVKNAIKSLEKIEGSLNLASEKTRQVQKPEDLSILQDCVNRLENIHDQLRIAGGILYDTASISKEISAIAQRLKTIIPKTEQ